MELCGPAAAVRILYAPKPPVGWPQLPSSPSPGRGPSSSVGLTAGWAPRLRRQAASRNQAACLAWPQFKASIPFLTNPPHTARCTAQPPTHYISTHLHLYNPLLPSTDSTTQHHVLGIFRRQFLGQTDPTVSQPFFPSWAHSPRARPHFSGRPPPFAIHDSHVPRPPNPRIMAQDNELSKSADKGKGKAVDDETQKDKAGQPAANGKKEDDKDERWFRPALSQRFSWGRCSMIHRH